jgi:hypothetical protein
VLWASVPEAAINKNSKAVLWKLQYIAPTLGLFMQTLAYSISATLALHLMVLSIRCGRHAWEKLKNSETVLPVATGIAFVATIAQVILWEPALLEPGGLRYAHLRHLGLIALWVFVPAFVILAVLLIKSQVSRRRGDCASVTIRRPN